jgi:hypothetical protein
MDGNFTIAPPGADATEFVDLRGLKTLFGIGRSLAYLLIERGDIRSVCLRRHGCVKGKRLVDVRSVRQFLAAQSEEVDPRLSAICKEANRVMREKKAEREASDKTGSLESLSRRDEQPR